MKIINKKTYKHTVINLRKYRYIFYFMILLTFLYIPPPFSLSLHFSLHSFSLIKALIQKIPPKSFSFTFGRLTTSLF